MTPNEEIASKTNQILSQKVFPLFKCQVCYSAKSVEHINDIEDVFSRWIKSNMMHNYDSNDFHQQMLECVDDEQLEGSSFLFQNITDVIIDFYRTRDFSASSYIELPKKYKNSKQFFIHKMMMSFVLCDAP